MALNDYFIIEGGHTLAGEIIPQGAKNEVLQLICATVLTKEKVTIKNVPDIVDVRKLIKLVSGLGVAVQRPQPDVYTFEAADIDFNYTATDEYQSEARKIRGSVMLLAPLMHRFGRAYIPSPGGDKIGRRRLDTHFNAFIKLGAEVKYSQDTKSYYLDAKALKGTHILMDEISVTGTANIVMGAVMTPGTTTIYNAACEPYLQQLCLLLQRMGADINGVGSNLLTIRGVTSLSGAEITVMPDMIEVGSFIGLAAMTQSDITIKNVDPTKLGVIPGIFQSIGIKMNLHKNSIHIPAMDMYEITTFMDGSILTIYDSPWPGFTPDLMSIALVVATQARGSVLIHQKMFESRLFFVDKLIDMGAQIILCDPHRATVIGLARKQALRGIEMSSPDIRAGVSLLIAALSAEGTSTIYNINQIDRGYQDIDGRLGAIGAKIKRVKG
jgi:UDP-N-acetylglucosamine 1-carboxyvinyltransferase